MLSILTACGKRDYSPISHNDTIIKHSVEFQTEAKARNVPSKINRISFAYKEMNKSTLGTCTILYKTDKQGTYEYGRKIEVNSILWPGLTDTEKDQLITHELGHCSLNRPHREGYITISSPSMSQVKLSVMNPIQLRDSSYNDLNRYYLEELFNPTVNSLAMVSELLDAPLEYLALYTTTSDTSNASLIQEDESLPIFIDPKLKHHDCIRIENIESSPKE